MTLYIRWFALAALAAGSLSASVPDQDQDGTRATDRTLLFSSLPSGPAELSCYKRRPQCGEPRPCDQGKKIDEMNADLTTPRERKEWREMSPTAVNKFPCALHVMDECSTKELRDCYGDSALAFPDFLNMHACVAADPRGDQGHRSPSFMLFHKAFLLTFENAMLAVDPGIGAMPWWNMPLDSAPVLYLNGSVKVPAGKYYCPRDAPFGSPADDPANANPGCDPNKYIWSDKFFGKQLGSGPNFEVTDGLLPWRKMPRWADFDHEYWKETKNVTNQCITDKYFSPLSAKKHSTLRKQARFGDGPHPTCERCCDGASADGHYEECMCDQHGDRSDVYMRGPTLDTKTCSPYVTRNPNGRGSGTTEMRGAADWSTSDGWPGNGNGRSQQDSLIRYTQDDFDACANSSNTRNWMEWQNCMEEDLYGTLEGVYCPAEKETCTQREMKKVYALHSTGHDKTLGEIGDVTTSPADPVLFFSYHNYVDKNFMEWQKSMKATGRWQDPGTTDLGDDPDNKNHFGYPKKVTLHQWKENTAKFATLPFIKNLISNSSERMSLRNFIVPVDPGFTNFDMQLWHDLRGDGNPATMQWPSESLSLKWEKASTQTDDHVVAIFKVHAGDDPEINLYDTPTASSVYTPGVSPNFLGPACSSSTNVGPDITFTATGKTEPYFNPNYGANCREPIYPSPLPGSLTYNLTNGARTYATSGPFVYLTKYVPEDFFNRASFADPSLPWIPGTTLEDITLGGLPYRNLFVGYDGGQFGYSNKDIMEWSLPCFEGRSPNNKAAPCAPYTYSIGD